MSLLLKSWIGFSRGGGQSWEPYLSLPTGLPEAATAEDDIVFCLMQISGSNFIDGVNGWEFPINNMDFAVDEATWTGDTSIFPFKTAATISPPADADIKALIIPYDVNNFWYAADGTPNSIPVQAFFQNIDFANKCFCAHVEHTVNADLEELTPSGVKYITLYKAAKTVTSTYTDFFGADCALPTSNVLFVSKAGDDATGDGTFANPYLTIDKGLTTITNGHTLWILSGVYNEASPGYDYLRNSRAGVEVSAKCSGNVELQSANATYVLYTTNTKINLHGITLQGKSLYQSNPTLYNRVRFKTGATMTNGVPATISNSTINGTWSCYGIVNYIGNYSLNGVVTLNRGGYVTAHYNKFKTTTGNNNNGITYGTSLTGSEFKYCYFDFDGSGKPFNIGNTAIKTNPHVHTISRCIFRSYKGIYGKAADIAASSTYQLKVNYCSFYDKNESGLITEAFGINLTGLDAYHTSHEIDHNYFYSANVGLANAIVINPTGGVNAVKLNYNRFFMDSTSGTAISFGEGTAGAIDGTEIIGNYFRGCLYNYPDAVQPSTHGLLANGGKNFVIKYNRFEYLPLGLVIKANDGQAYTSGGAFYNVFFNNTADIYYRRVVDLVTANNTAYNSTINKTRVMAVDYQGYDCDGHAIKNNIFQSNAVGSTKLVVATDLWARAEPPLSSGTPISFDNNIWSYASEATKFMWDLDPGVDNWTYDEAVTAGYIVNGELATPVFTDAANGDLTLQAGSPGLGDGTDLGVDLDDGLDVTTDWNTDETDDDPDNYPTIVTKQQGASWDKGAYVH